MFEAVVPVSSKSVSIPSEWLDPSYTDKRFTEVGSGRTIFLLSGIVTLEHHGVKMIEGAQYEYSDRLLQHVGYDALHGAQKEAKEAVGNNDTAAYYEAVLQKAFENPNIDLQHIIAGVMGDGYSYHVYGFVNKPSEA